MAAPEFEDWQLALIEKLRVARLGTVAVSGKPHLVPVCYALLDGNIWLAVDEKPKSTNRLARLQNIERDPRVSLLLDHYEDDWQRLAWVRIDGTAAILPRGAGAPEALAALRRRYPQYREMDLEDLPLISITPTAVAAWRWSNR